MWRLGQRDRKNIRFNIYYVCRLPDQAKLITSGRNFRGTAPKETRGGDCPRDASICSYEIGLVASSSGS